MDGSASFLAGRAADTMGDFRQRASVLASVIVGGLADKLAVRRANPDAGPVHPAVIVDFASSRWCAVKRGGKIG